MGRIHHPATGSQSGLCHLWLLVCGKQLVFLLAHPLADAGGELPMGAVRYADPVLKRNDLHLGRVAEQWRLLVRTALPIQ